MLKQSHFIMVQIVVLICQASLARGFGMVAFVMPRATGHGRLYLHLAGGSEANAPKPLRKGLGSAALLLPWMIWKHRNDCF
jgi:hypothetical protein